MNYVNDRVGAYKCDFERVSQEDRYALENALRLMVEALSHMQQAMKTMEMKMDKTETTVQMMVERMRAVEDKLMSVDRKDDSPPDQKEATKELECKPGSRDDRERTSISTRKQQTRPQTRDIPQRTVSKEESRCDKRLKFSPSRSSVQCRLVGNSIPKTPPASPASVDPDDEAAVSSNRSSKSSPSLQLPFAGPCPSSSHPLSPTFSRRLPPVSSSFTMFKSPSELCKRSLAKKPSPSKTTENKFSKEKKRALLGKQLLKASQEGKARDVRSLLQLGADPNFKDELKWTPLHKAVVCGQTDIVTILLEKGVNLNARNANGLTALHLAALCDSSGLCACFLIYAGCNVNCRNQFGRTALHYAVETGNMATLRALLTAGAVSIKDIEGKTPYDLANSDRVRKLLNPESVQEKKRSRLSNRRWKF